MTIPVSPRRAGPYAGTGAQTAFGFSFKVFDETDLRVVELDVPTSVETEPTLNADYTVALNPDQESTPGGTVNFLVAPAATKKVTIVGDLSYEQPSDLPDGGAYRAQQVENGLDRIVMLLQQIKEITDRCAQVPVSSTDTAILFESINVLAANLPTLQTVVANISDLVTLASDIADVNTLAAISAQVQVVASIAAQVVAVAAVSTEVATVAGISADVVEVAANMADILTVVANLPTIATKANAGANNDITSLAAFGTPLSGFKNLLINGDFRINQRNYVSGAATTGANQYTLDRWRVVTSGQNLSFAAAGSGRQITAPAGGVEQVIEGANIAGGDHVINWTGTATCTVNGTPRAKGAVFTLTAGVDATVRFIGGTVSLAQLEPGAVSTVFERRHIGIEQTLCERYFRLWEAGVADTAVTASTRDAMVQFPEMRATPTATNLAAIGSQSNVGTVSLVDVTARGLRISVTAAGSATMICRRSISLSAEL